ncbi:unnamed protein product [Owenia fusiformis]|uniref:Uncharacterized protein n=1 Tax=Owenia fusiformis TaxID=6347 RepID=A0A8J1TD48_OWEFU|nr:unnamed protein product [Owenia fusiformis]
MATPGPGGSMFRMMDEKMPKQKKLDLKTTHTGNKQKQGKISETPTSGRPCQEHSFLTDVADVRQMEQGLLQLLDDFHSGKLQAFGQECPFEKLDEVREQQERLARLHFEVDSQQDLQGLQSPEARKAANENMTQLMDNLQELCTSIQSLQKSGMATDRATTPSKPS